VSLFVPGEFTSHSGLALPFKIDCDALSNADLDCLAQVYARRQQFSDVYGVPSGGTRFAEALRRYTTPNGSFILLADDVLTTGAAITELRAEWPESMHWTILGVVLFARGPCPDWVTPIFQLGEVFR
jgi:hypothetical protein